MWLGVGIFAVLFGQLVKKNKKYFYCFMFFMWILFWSRACTQDRAMYLVYYNQIHSMSVQSNLEFGFQAFMLFSKFLHLPFEGFVALFSGVAFILMSKVIVKCSINPVLVSGLYFLYPYILDADQIRSFFAVSIVLYGMQYLLWNFEHKILKYILFCCLASLFHITALFYIIYVFIVLDRKIAISIVGLFCCVFYLFRGLLINILYKVAFRDITSKINYYLLNSNNENGIIVTGFFVVIFLLSILICAFQLKNNDIDRQFAMKIIKMNILSFIIFPLLLLDNTFIRLPRLVLIMDYIMVSNMIGAKITKRKQFVYYFGFLGIVLLRFFAYCLGAGWETYFIPLFF